MNKNLNYKLGIFLTYIAQGIHIISGLLYTPIMLRLLGQSEYGLYSLVSSTVSYLSLFSLGFSGAYMKFYSEYKVKDDDEGIAKLNGMFLAIFSVLMLAAILCGAVLIQNVDIVFGNGLTQNELQKAKVLMTFLVINLAFSFPMSVFESYVSAHERFIFQKTLTVLQYLCSPLITLPLLLVGYRSVAMVAVTTSLTLAKLICNTIFCKKELEIKFDFHGLNPKLFKELSGFTVYIFINQIVDQINWSLDSVLLGRIRGTTSVAIYSVASQLNSMYRQFSNAIPSVFVARVNLLVSSGGTKKDINKLFYSVGRLQFSVIGLIVSGYIFFGKQFITIWAGTEYADSYRIGLLLMIPETIPFIQCLGYEIQRAMNMHKTRSIVYLIVAAANVFVSIPCIYAFGTSGAAIGTAITFIIGHCIFMNWYYHNRMDLNMLCFWKNMNSFLPAYAPIIICGLLINHCFAINSYFELGISVIIYAVVYATSIFFIALHADERNIVLTKLKKK